MKAEYKREKFAEDKEFAQKLKDELKCEIVWIEVNNKNIPVFPSVKILKSSKLLNLGNFL